MKWRLIGGLAAIHAGGAYAVFAYAANVHLFWILWYITLGFLLGISFAPKPGRLVYLLSLAASLSILISIVARGLPIHSLGWENINKVEFKAMKEQVLFEVTDPGVLRRFEAFGRRGRYVTLWKTSYKGCTLVVWKPGMGETSFFHGDCLGERPGNYIQTAFIPSEDGMKEFIEELLRSHTKN